MDTIIKLSTKVATQPKNIPNAGLVRLAIEAYNTHNGLIITPDAVWISILSQVGLYFNYNTEEIRNKYVSFKDKKEIEIFINSYDEIIPKLSNKIDEEILDKTFKSWVETKFSTSTPKTQIVKKAMMLGIFNKYFDYCITECGISEITIKGTYEDWKTIYNNLNKLLEFDYKDNRYNIQQWYDGLRNFIIEFMKIKINNINVEFWMNFVNSNNEISGGPIFKGNIQALCEFYIDFDKTLHQKKKDDWLTINKIPPEFVEIYIKNNTTRNNLIFKAGNYNHVFKNNYFTVIPDIGSLLNLVPITLKEMHL